MMMGKHDNVQKIQIKNSSRVKVKDVRLEANAGVAQQQNMPKSKKSAVPVVAQAELRNRIKALRKTMKTSGRMQFHRQLVLLLNKLSEAKEDFMEQMSSADEYADQLRKIEKTISLFESKIKAD